MYNEQVHFSGCFSFININFQSAKGDNPKRPPLVRFSTFQNNETWNTPVWLAKMLSIHLVKCKNAFQWIDFYSVDQFVMCV